MLSHTLIPVLMLAPSAFSQRVRTDSGAQGSPLEIVHLYNDEWFAFMPAFKRSYCGY